MARDREKEEEEAIITSDWKERGRSIDIDALRERKRRKEWEKRRREERRGKTRLKDIGSG
jgi:F0F1-type ATP synthase epsilon subunit